MADITKTPTPRMTATARTFLRRLRHEERSPLRRRPAHTAVHFHRGPQGSPAVCDDPRCASPHLDA